MADISIFCWATSDVFPGSARSFEILQNCVERQVFGGNVLDIFLAFTLKLPIQTSLSVAPNSKIVDVQVKKVKNSSKRAQLWVLA